MGAKQAIACEALWALAILLKLKKALVLNFTFLPSAVCTCQWFFVANFSFSQISQTLKPLFIALCSPLKLFTTFGVLKSMIACGLKHCQFPNGLFCFLLFWVRYMALYWPTLVMWRGGYIFSGFFCLILNTYPEFTVNMSFWVSSFEGHFF